MKRFLRVGFDARLAIEPHRGMGRYLRSLIFGRENDLFGFCARGERSDSLTLIDRGFQFYPLWEQVSLPRLIADYELDVFLAPYNTAPLLLPKRAQLILVVHDLIYLEPLPPSRSLYQNAGRAYRRLVVPSAIRRSRAILTVSNYTKQLLIERQGVSPERIWVIPCSLTNEWFDAVEFPRTQYRYMFLLAGEAPSKNLARAIQAFARFRQMTGDNGIRMKIAGVAKRFHESFAALARQEGVSECVQFLDYISDIEMRGEYRGAELFVMPSLQEGFGIPILEAMASGVPVISSSACSLPEVAGAAARYFDPLSVDEMALAMRDVTGDPMLREQLSKAGALQAHKFHAVQIDKDIQAFWAWVEGSWNGHPETIGTRLG